MPCSIIEVIIAHIVRSCVPGEVIYEPGRQRIVQNRVEDLREKASVFRTKSTREEMILIYPFKNTQIR